MVTWPHIGTLGIYGCLWHSTIIWPHFITFFCKNTQKTCIYFWFSAKTAHSELSICLMIAAVVFRSWWLLYICGIHWKSAAKMIIKLNWSRGWPALRLSQLTIVMGIRVVSRGVPVNESLLFDVIGTGLFPAKDPCRKPINTPTASSFLMSYCK